MFKLGQCRCRVLPARPRTPVKCNPNCQLGNRCLPGASRTLSCEAGCPRVTVRYQFLPRLMTLMARRSWTAPCLMALRPSAFQAGHTSKSPSGMRAYSGVVVRRRSPLVAAVAVTVAVNSAQAIGSNRPRSLQGMACVRSGQAAACPLISDRSVRRGSRVKRDFACTFTSAFDPQ